MRSCRCGEATPRECEKVSERVNAGAIVLGIISEVDIEDIRLRIHTEFSCSLDDEASPTSDRGCLGMVAVSADLPDLKRTLSS